MDRDGVINQDSNNFIRSPNQWIPLPDSLSALKLLSENGFRIVILTNQSGIGRKYFDIQTLNDIHNLLRKYVLSTGGKISALHYCPHIPNDHCNCRKPLSGLYSKTQNPKSLSNVLTFTVGDSLRDLQAALSVESQPILVCTGKGKMTQQENKSFLDKHNIPVCQDLIAAAKYIIDSMPSK